MYAGRLQQRTVAHDGRLFMIHAQSYALVKELFIVHKQRKIADILMLKFVRVAATRTIKICVLNNGEQQTFRDGTQEGVAYGKEFRSGRECKRLEFDSRQVLAREAPPIIHFRSVNQQYGGVRPDAPDQ